MFLLLNDYMILSITNFVICLHREMLMLFQKTDISCEIVVEIFIHITPTLYTNFFQKSQTLARSIVY